MRPVDRKGRPAVIEMTLLALVTLGLLAYLVYALLQPEKF
jgi:K+-transporting ATPase KdpF subunit